MPRLFMFCLIAISLISPAQAEAPRVVATIAPLAGIAAAVMEGAASPTLLIQNNASPHTYSLRPADRAALEQAQVILWVGESLESFLPKSLHSLSQKPIIIELAEDKNLQHLPNRAGGLWEEEHEEHDEHDHHEHGATDPHLWLSPSNAIKIAQTLAERLAQKDASNAALYRKNAQNFATRLNALDTELLARLTPYQSKPYLVFHDAFQYFQAHYKLAGIGALTLHPDEGLSAARLAEIQAKIKAEAIACLYAEPQFNSKALAMLTAGTAAKVGLLNVDASDLPLDANLYFSYLERLAQSFISCYQ